MKERPRIPNFNSFSTYLDRATIEVVKRTIFQLKIDEGIDDLPKKKVRELEGKIKIQDKIIKEIRNRFMDFMLKVWLIGDYEVIDETRTFE